MKRKYLHVTMFVAMDRFYNENSPDTLIQFLSDINTYIFAGLRMVDLAIQADFDKSMDQQNIGEEVDAETAYNAVKKFLAEEYAYYSRVFPDEKAEPFDELFSEISMEQWQAIYDEIVDEEEK